MKILFFAILISMALSVGAQSTDKYFMLDSNETAVLESSKTKSFFFKNHEELISINRTTDDGIKMTFKSYFAGAHTYDYSTFYFDSNDRCYANSQTSNITNLGSILSLMSEMYEKRPNDYLYHRTLNIKVKIEYDFPNKTYTMTYTRK